MKHIVGLVGAIGSGTSSAKKFLEEFGFRGYSYGAEVAEYIRADSSRGGTDRKNLQFWGQKALEGEGNNNYWDERISGRVVTDGILKAGGKGIVLDSLKYDFQIDFWITFCAGEFPFHLISVDAGESLRCPRLIGRGREGDPKDNREFDEANGRDLYGCRREFGQDTAHCLNSCNFDLQMFNDKTPEIFRGELLSYFREREII